MKKNLSTKDRAIQNYFKLDARLEVLKSLKSHEEQKFKRVVLDDFNRKIERVNEEIKLSESLIKYGWIYVSTWSRDCDMCESTRVYKFQSIKAYYKANDSFGESLEGPGSFSIITKEQYDEERREPTRDRDRILEAFENGNGYSIYV
jgi:hypothetical protein